MSFDPFSMIGSLASGLFGFLGANKSSDAQQQIANQNIAMQEEFAKHGVQWKVEDAKAAGINPLAALGAPTTSFSPVSLGGDGPGAGLQAMGQNLERAFKAASTDGMREEADNSRLRKLQLEKASLENDVLRQELNSREMRSSRLSGQVGPPVPVATTISEKAPVKADDIKQKAEEYPAVKIVRPFGYPLASNPYFGDGQDFENRYGDSEIGSTVKFGVNTLADHFYSGYKWFGQPWMERARAARRRLFPEARW